MNTDKTSLELRDAHNYINLHPILSYSPGDLKRAGIMINSYLEDYDDAEQKIWLEYYEDDV